MSQGPKPRIAILGGGPVGLEAAVYAAQLKLPFRLYERGKVGENLRAWGHVKLFTPFGLNSTSLGRATLRREVPQIQLPAEDDLLTGREHVAAYLEPLAQCGLLAGHLETETEVLYIGQNLPGKEEKRAAQHFHLLMQTDQGKEKVEEADWVLDCTGTYGNGRWLGGGGIPALGERSARAHISYGLEDILGVQSSRFADKTTLVIGAGHSAATTVLALAELARRHPSGWVIWLARGSGSQPIRRVLNDPFRERDLLASRANMLATRGEGHVEFHSNAVIEAVEYRDKEGFRVSARVGGTVRSWEADRVIANVGYEAGPTPWLRFSDRQTDSRYQMLGIKGAVPGSHPLMQAGFEQVRAVFARIMGKQDLNLYRRNER